MASRVYRQPRPRMYAFIPRDLKIKSSHELFIHDPMNFPVVHLMNIHPSAGADPGFLKAGAGVKTEMGQYWFLRTSAPWEVLVRNQSALVRIFTIP